MVLNVSGDSLRAILAVAAAPSLVLRTGRLRRISRRASLLSRRRSAMPCHRASEPNRALKEGKVAARAADHRHAAVHRRPALRRGLAAGRGRATDLTQRDPDNGKPMTDATRIQIAYDDRYLYVAVSALDSDAGVDRRRPWPPRRDAADRLDHDRLRRRVTTIRRRTSSQPIPRLAGRLHVLRRHEPGLATTTRSGTSARRSPTPAGPRNSAFRFRRCASPRRRSPGRSGDSTSQRQIRRKSETGTWVAEAARRARRGVVLRPPRVRRAGAVAAAAGADSVRRSRAASIVPQRAARRRRVDGPRRRAWGSGTGATLSATFNPDFGQVEQDPAVLNLSVFETFFPEKRPFFLEDSRTFVPPVRQLSSCFTRGGSAASPGRLPLAAGERIARAAGRNDDPRRHQADGQRVAAGPTAR